MYIARSVKMSEPRWYEPGEVIPMDINEVLIIRIDMQTEFMDGAGI